MGFGTATQKEKHGYKEAKSTEIKCKQCIHSITRKIQGIGGIELGYGMRCEIIGDYESKKYRIHPEYTCKMAKKRDIR